MQKWLVSVVALSGLIACVDHDARPYDQYVRDYSQIHDIALPEDDAGPQEDDAGPREEDAATTRPLPTTCSPSGGDAVEVTFVNAGSVDGTLTWVDFDCEDRPYAELAVGAAHRQSTFTGHVWRLVTPTQVLDEVTVTVGNITVAMGGD